MASSTGSTRGPTHPYTPAFAAAAGDSPRLQTAKAFGRALDEIQNQLLSAWPQKLFNGNAPTPRPGESRPAPRPTAEVLLSAAAPSEELMKKSPAELKRILAGLGGKTAGLLEKRDYVNAIVTLRDAKLQETIKTIEAWEGKNFAKDLLETATAFLDAST